MRSAQSERLEVNEIGGEGGGFPPFSDRNSRDTDTLKANQLAQRDHSPNANKDKDKYQSNITEPKKQSAFAWVTQNNNTNKKNKHSLPISTILTLSNIQSVRHYILLNSIKH